MAPRRRTWLDVTTGWLPRGHRLSDVRWPSRHHAMLWVLWLHLPVLTAVGTVAGHPVWHVAADVAALALGATAASLRPLGRRLRTVAAVVTLVSCSAVLVHLTHGTTESHFHFLAVVAFIALYQEWLPFAIALGYVLVHHAVLGVLAPEAVFGHEAARRSPVPWALVHAGFVALASLASLAAWRLAEVERENVERVLAAAGDGIYGVDPAGRITFVNPTLCDLVGQTATSLQGRDHHVALGHRLVTGATVGPAECPLCTAARQEAAFATEEVCLGGAGGTAVPVEHLIRSAGSGPGKISVVTVRDLRERQALEAVRHEAEAERDQLASIVEASTDVALIGRTDGRVMWLNAAGRKLLGFDPAEDITAYRIEDLFSAEEMARVYAEDMPVLARDGDWRGEWIVQAQDGTQIPVAVTHHVHQDTRGEHLYVSGTMRDLRPQLAQEQARRESEQRLAAAEGVARLGSWAWNHATDAVTWSPGMYRLHGMEPGDGVETFQAWVGTIHPDDRETAVAKADLARFQPVLDEFTYRAVRTDGSELVIQARGELIANDKGEPLMVGTLLDITDRYAAAQALRESEERARSVIATAGDAYLQFDCDGRVTEWNDEAERTFGWSREEVVGRVLPAVLAPGDREAFGRRIGLCGQGCQPSQRERFELTMRHRSGEAIPVEVTSWTIETGGICRVSCFVRDVTERHAAERAKNGFISVVGHELRTPLTSIHGALGLLGSGLLGELNERGQRMVDIAVHNTDRLVRLVNDILDIERLDSGRVTMEPVVCDLQDLAVRSVEGMRPMAETAGVLLEVEAAPATVWADPDRMEQAMTNLLSNAIKFSPPGATVWTVVQVAESEVRIEVRDAGRGIPPEHLELIFERFQQVDGSDSRDKGGTGLGLAICRAIVEQHGGRIWAESTPGAGSTFTIALPVVRPHDGGRGPGPMRVLICDEDPTVRASIATMLGSHGYEPVEVASGSEIVDAAAACRPAVILLDLGMGSAEGWRAAVELGDRAETRDIPVVVLSLQDEGAGGDEDSTADPFPRASVPLDEQSEATALLAAVQQAVESQAVGCTMLLVEDDDELAEVLRERFRRLGMRVHHARTAREALTICADVVPDILVLDLLLPDEPGYALVARMRRDDRLRGVPLTVYTASDLSEADREGLRLGETQYFTKGRVEPEEFERRVVDLLGQLTAPSRDGAHV